MLKIYYYNLIRLLAKKIGILIHLRILFGVCLIKKLAHMLMNLILFIFQKLIFNFFYIFYKFFPAFLEKSYNFY